MRRFRIVALALLLPALVFAADWPGWLGPKRDGSTTETVQPWKADLKATWRIPVGEGHSSPIIVGDRVYLHTRVAKKDQEVVTAYNLADGKEVWSKLYDRGEFKSPFGLGPRGTPLVADGKLYTYGATGILICRDATTGEPIWQKNTMTDFKAKNLFFGMSASPILVGDNVLVNVGAPGASLVAFDRKTGAVAWKEGDAKASYSSAIETSTGTAKEALFFTQQGLQAVDPATGKTRWTYGFVDTLNESSATPVRVGEMILASSITGGMVALERDDKEKAGVKVVWKNPVLCCYFSTPVPVGEHLYLVTGGLIPPPQSNLHCVDPKTGKILWTREKVGKYHAALVRTGDGKLLMLDDYGNLSLIDPKPEEFKELAKVKLCGATWVTPAVAGGKIVLRDEKELICVDAK